MYMIAYGMNTNIASMQFRAPAAVWLGPVQLPGHKLVFKYFADIEPADSGMDAVLWAIDCTVLQAMDRCEGYPAFYQRKQVEVEYAGQTVAAWVYYMNVDTEYCAPPSSYLDLLIEGYAYANINLPAYSS